MKPIQLTPEQRQEIDRRRKASDPRSTHRRAFLPPACLGCSPRIAIGTLQRIDLSELLDLYCSRSIYKLNKSYLHMYQF